MIMKPTAAASADESPDESDVFKESDHTVFHGAWSNAGAVFYGPDNEGELVPQTSWEIKTEIVRTDEQTITMVLERRLVGRDHMSRCEIHLDSRAELAFLIDLLGSCLLHFPQVPLGAERDYQTRQWRSAQTKRYGTGTLVTEAES